MNRDELDVDGVELDLRRAYGYALDGNFEDAILCLISAIREMANLINERREGQE